MKFGTWLLINVGAKLPPHLTCVSTLVTTLLCRARKKSGY